MRVRRGHRILFPEPPGRLPANVRRNTMKELLFKGEPVHLKGTPGKKGDTAPDFTAVNQEFREIRFSDYRDKIKVFTSFLSLDTNPATSRPGNSTRRRERSPAGQG